MDLSVTVPVTDSSCSAAIRAASNWALNLRALSDSQPSVAESLRNCKPPVIEWLFGRDGCLTALTEGERWWSGCSLPARAATQMLKKFTLAGVVGCFLDPPHAAAIRVTLDKLRANQAIIVVQPLLPELATAMHCDDFSADISAGRLWFVAGTRWAESLADLFLQRPGLPTAGHFIRLPTSAADSIDKLVVEAQAVLAGENTRRANQTRQIRDARRVAPASHSTGGGFERTSPRATRSSHHILVLSPSHFLLWNDAATTLGNTLKSHIRTSDTLTFLDLDDPRCESPLILGECAAKASAIVAADIARADAPGVIADAMPWITWITKGVVPPAVTAGPNDRLLLADPAWRSLAAESHWPEEKVGVAKWPRWLIPAQAVTPGVRHLTIVENTQPILAPDRIDDYSSHRLLWDAILQELRRDPAAVGNQPASYLSNKMRRAGIDSRAFDPALFLDRLIYPAIQQSIVRGLLKANLPLQIHGSGWTEIDEFRPFAAGPIHDRTRLDAILGEAAAVLYLAPSADAHPLDSARVPLIRAGGKLLQTIMHDTRALLTSRAISEAGDASSDDVLSTAKILEAAKLS